MRASAGAAAELLPTHAGRWSTSSPRAKLQSIGWRGIGKDNGLPRPKLHGDLRHFKKTTSTASAGKRNAIVMGRKTWESKEVGCSPLPNRLNVVVRHNALERLARALRLAVG